MHGLPSCVAAAPLSCMGASRDAARSRGTALRFIAVVLYCAAYLLGQTANSTNQALPPPGWQYGGFADIGYLYDFNSPSSHLFRSRGTTFHVNEVDLNMADLYLRRTASQGSRWGMEVTLQGGKDSQVFGFSATAPNLAGSKWLRHLGPTDVSYLAPAGKGLTIQGGIFNSFIGYDSLYAKDNFTYTRPWGADFTPYLMLGVNAQYPFTEKMTGTLFLINGYWHLAHANNVPSSGGQIAYKATKHVTLKETVLYGPHRPTPRSSFGASYPTASPNGRETDSQRPSSTSQARKRLVLLEMVEHFG